MNLSDNSSEDAVKKLIDAFSEERWIRSGTFSITGEQIYELRQALQIVSAIMENTKQELLRLQGLIEG